MLAAAGLSCTSRPGPHRVWESGPAEPREEVKEPQKGALTALRSWARQRVRSARTGQKELDSLVATESHTSHFRHWWRPIAWWEYEETEVWKVFGGGNPCTDSLLLRPSRARLSSTSRHHLTLRTASLHSRPITAEVRQVAGPLGPSSARSARGITGRYHINARAQIRGPRPREPCEARAAVSRAPTREQQQSYSDPTGFQSYDDHGNAIPVQRWDDSQGDNKQYLVMGYPVGTVLSDGGVVTQFGVFYPAGGEEVSFDEEVAENELVSAVQLGLDGASFIPGVGAPFALASAAISYSRGDHVGASLSMAAIIPGGALIRGAGMIGKAISAATRAGKAVSAGGKAGRVTSAGTGTAERIVVLSLCR